MRLEKKHLTLEKHIGKNPNDTKVRAKLEKLRALQGPAVVQQHPPPNPSAPRGQLMTTSRKSKKPKLNVTLTSELTSNRKHQCKPKNEPRLRTERNTKEIVKLRKKIKECGGDRKLEVKVSGLSKDIGNIKQMRATQTED